MYKLLLCLRYLRTRYIALASIISVMLGVATMIVVNSVMAGFSSQMRERIHGLLADVVVETINLDGVDDVEKQIALARQACGDHIEAVTGTVEVYGIMNFRPQGSSQYITRAVTLVGIKPDEKAKVGPLIDNLRSYKEIRAGESNRLIREPLRSRDEVPSWNLTEEAKDRRRRNTIRELDYLNMREQAELAPSVPSAPTVPVPTFDTGSGETPAPNFDETTDGAPDFETVPEDETTPDDEAVTPDIFNQPGLDDPAFIAEADPYAPQEARLYVGLGLVSYPYADPETGEVVEHLTVQPGDDVVISTVTAGTPPEPARFNATVVDLFQSGMSEYDSSLVFCNLEALQQARGMFDPIRGTGRINRLQIKLKDYSAAPEVLKSLQAVFPPHQFSVQTWEQKQGPLLAAVEVEQTILNVLLFLIIAVAGFGILAIFFMIVVEKTKDIGILRSLGASSSGVMSVFLSYGLALGLVGGGVGVVCGLLFVRYINEIEQWLTWLTGRKVFDQRIYYFPEIPTRVDASMVFWVAAGAVLIAVMASIIPARRAAKLHPVEALRYE